MAEKAKALEGAARNESEAEKMPQIERFKQAARELKCDDDPDRFAERVRRLAKAPPAPKAKMKKAKPR